LKLETLWNYTLYSHCVGWVDPRAIVDAVEKGNICRPFQNSYSAICGLLAFSQATIELGRYIVLFLVFEVVLSGRQKN
jgi:hypothetical protein